MYFFEDLELPNLVKTQLLADHRIQAAARRLHDRPARRPTSTCCARCAARSAGASRSARTLAQAAAAKPRKSWSNCCRTAFEDDHRVLTLRSRKSHHLRTRMHAIPFIDPFDLRYSNRIKVPKPSSQAVMFCVMDVSGSMDEQRKDTAKRFFILLYLFLNARLRKDRGGVHPPPHAARRKSTKTSSSIRANRAARWCRRALHLLQQDHARALFAAATGTSMCAQASDGDNWDNDSVELPRAADQTPSCPRCSTTPMSRSPTASRRTCGRSTRRSRDTASAFRDAEDRVAGRHLSGVPRTVQEATEMTTRHPRSRHDRADAQEPAAKPRAPAGAVGMDLRTDRAGARGNPRASPKIRPRHLSEPARNHHRRADDGCVRVGRHAGELPRTGRSASNSSRPRRAIGAARWAWRTRSSSTPNPCIAYLMEENTMTMQALVIAHAAYGHNSFFKGNYLFRMWTDARRDHRLHACSRRTTSPNASSATASTRSRSCSTPAMRCRTTASTATSGRPKLSLAKEDAMRQQGARGATCSRRSTTCGARCRKARRSSRRRSDRAAFPTSRRKTCCTSSRRTRRCWSRGSARSCASCARSRSISIRSARRR